MAKKVNVDLNFDGSAAVKTMGELKNSLEGVNESSKSLKAQLREMTLELQGLEPGTQRFQELSIAAGQLKDQIADTNAVINATAGSVGENLGSAIGNTAQVGIAGFQGLASAQALFGTESEALTQTMVKLQAVAGLSDAIKTLGGLGDTITNIKASFTAALTSLGLLTTAKSVDTAASTANAVATTALAAAEGTQAVATEGATVAQYSLNTAMLANPVFLIIAGVVALGAALYAFAGDNEAAKAEVDALTQEMEGLQAQIEFMNSYSSLDARQKVADAKLKGASERELLQVELDVAQERIDRDWADANETIKINQKIVENEASTAEQVKASLDLIYKAETKQQLLRKETLALSSELQLKQKELDDKDAAEQAKRDEEAAARRKAANDKWVADKKSVLDRIKALELEYADSQLGEEEKEIELNKRKYQELITLADKYKLDKTKLVENLSKSEADIRKKYDDAEAKIAQDKQDKLDEIVKKANADALVEQENYDEVYRDATQTAKENELEDVNDKYFQLITKAEKYGYDTTELKEKQEKELKDIRDKYTAEEEKESQKKFDKIKSTLADMSAIFQSIRGEGNALGVDLITTTLDGISSFVDLAGKKFDSLAEKVNAYSQAIGGVLQGIVSAVSEANKAKLDETLASIEQSTNAETDALTKKYNSGVISKEQYDKQIEDLDKAAKKKELEAKKKAFEQDKKTKIASATIAGIQGAVSAFTGAMSLGPIAGPIIGGLLAGAVGVMTGLNISKISKAKFDGGGGDSPAAAPSIGGGGGGEASPKFQPTQFFGLGQTAQTFGGAGGGMTKVYVSETDITSTQNKVKVVEDRATIR